VSLPSGSFKEEENEILDLIEQEKIIDLEI
jgi:hypothetical protein